MLFLSRARAVKGTGKLSTETEFQNTRGGCNYSRTGVDEELITFR